MDKTKFTLETFSFPVFFCNQLYIVPGDQEGLFKLAIQLRTFFYSAIYNTAKINIVKINDKKKSKLEFRIII
jgi:hypothetical protein